MNAVLGVYYGSVGAEHSASLPDVSGAVELYKLYCALPRPGVKVSSLGDSQQALLAEHVQKLGGSLAADRLLEEHGEMLARWKRADAVGRKVAHVVMRSFYDDSYAQTAADRWLP